MELEVSPHPAAIFRVFLPILPLHEFLLAQHLAVEEPHCGDKVKQQDQFEKIRNSPGRMKANSV